MQHLDEGTIHAWLDDALPASEAAAVEAHVAQCAECASLVAEARGLIAGTSRIVSSLDHVPAGVIPKPQAPSHSLWHTLRLTPARASVAALILVAVASMFTARRGQLVQPIVRPTIAPQAATSAPAPLPEPSSSVASTPPMPQPKSTAKREVAELAKPAAPPPQANETRAAAPAPEAVTTTGVVASKAAADVAAVDSVRVQREPATAERNFAVAPAPAAAATAQRMMRQSFLSSAASPEGCYRFLTDSARPIAMPNRFALQRDSAGRNVVLRLSVENRPDSVLSGFAWRQTSPTSARLTAPTTQLLLTTGESGRARLETANEKIEVPLQRTVCRP